MCNNRRCEEDEIFRVKNGSNKRRRLVKAKHKQKTIEKGNKYCYYCFLLLSKKEELLLQNCERRRKKRDRNIKILTLLKRILFPACKKVTLLHNNREKKKIFLCKAKYIHCTRDARHELFFFFFFLLIQIELLQIKEQESSKY